MPFPPDMQTAIDDFFGSYTAIRDVNKINSDGHKYELYVYCKVVDALGLKFGPTPAALDATHAFNFRCGPGVINNTFSYFEFTTPKGDYQVRNGIEVRGHNLAHEIDIGVYHHNGSLRDGTRPDKQQLKLALECKFYSDPDGLKGEARKYLGLMSDLSANSTLRGQAGCVHLGFDFFKGFVTNVSASLRSDIQAFIDAYHLWCKFGIIPRSSQEADFIHQISNYATTRW